MYKRRTFDIMARNALNEADFGKADKVYLIDGKEPIIPKPKWKEGESNNTYFLEAATGPAAGAATDAVVATDAAADADGVVATAPAAVVAPVVATDADGVVATDAAGVVAPVVATEVKREIKETLSNLEKLNTNFTKDAIIDALKDDQNAPAPPVVEDDAEAKAAAAAKAEADAAAAAAAGGEGEGAPKTGAAVEGAAEGGRRRTKRKGRKGSKKSKKGAKKSKKSSQSNQSQNGGRRSRKNRRKHSHRRKH